MKIAVIGANGNVGTELCYMLKDNCEVIPIVRNKHKIYNFADGENDEADIEDEKFEEVIKYIEFLKENPS